MVHLVDSAGQKTAEGTGDRGGGEEDGGAECALATGVPECDVIVDAL